MTDYYVDEDYEDAFEEGDYDYYSGDEPPRPVEGPKTAEIEGRTSWMYLGLLLAMFVLLVGFSWACDDRSTTPGEPSTEESADVTSGAAVNLSIAINGDVVTVSGAVPDEAAKQQILIAIRDQYGPANVIDELTVDEGTSFDDGRVTITGSAAFDDGRPEALLQAISSGFGLAEGEFSIDRGDASVDAVSIEAELADGTIRLAGAVPDQESIAELTAAGEAVWGAGSVDTAGLTVADSTWTSGMIRVTGAAATGDARVESFPAEIQSRFGALVVVDVSGVAVDDDPAVLTTLEEELGAQVLAQPIQFAPLSSEIAAESDAILATIAETLNAVPDVSVEVVGHTDNVGAEDANQVLSLERAEAVIARLAELGVDPARLAAIGEGEATPLVSNDTPAGRDQNRRIEFRIVGAG